MSIFKKIFGTGNDTSKEVNENDYNPFQDTHAQLPVDEQFTLNFKKNGGKFLYCENIAELNEQFENILEENDWFESEALCLEPRLFKILEDNNIVYQNPSNPKFFFTGCESLVAEEGSIMFSSTQIRQKKAAELPVNIVVLASTSQIVLGTSDGLREIKKRYTTDYPTNITTIKYFEKAKEEDFLQYGSTPKNLYLLLLENL
ncbi:LUD domain-containing protein [Flavobacterium luminosum]|uniref:LUD domain-containing protein n=1 Tax=Flavobacterium luminosum TaxID=2949086 RepID=A0ABT0TM62_9FLAO|nr:LUD domain-containing protein [Flavobacterium sp. HXWNR70]MCL9808584.1 LUD domain-containing protein [Flavobacterium sp. HXWNR70]